MTEQASPPLTIYSRPGCHLCEQLVEALLPLVRDRVDLEIVDVDANEKLRADYGLRIPVVEYDGRLICQYTLDEAAISALLATIPAS